MTWLRACSSKILPFGARSPWVNKVSISISETEIKAVVHGKWVTEFRCSNTVRVSGFLTLILFVRRRLVKSADYDMPYHCYKTCQWEHIGLDWTEPSVTSIHCCTLWKCKTNPTQSKLDYSALKVEVVLHIKFAQRVYLQLIVKDNVMRSSLHFGRSKFTINFYKIVIFPRSVSSWNWWPSWRPTSAHQLRNAETKILECELHKFNFAAVVEYVCGIKISWRWSSSLFLNYAQVYRMTCGPDLSRFLHWIKSGQCLWHTRLLPNLVTCHS